MISDLHNNKDSVLILCVDDVRQLLASGLHYEYIICLDSQSVSPLSDSQIPGSVIYWLDIEKHYRRSDEHCQSRLTLSSLHSRLLSDNYYQGVYSSTTSNAAKVTLYLKDIGISRVYFWMPYTLSFDTRGHIVDIFKFLLIEQSINTNIRLIPLSYQFTILRSLKSRVSRAKTSISCLFLQCLNLIRLVYFFILMRPSVVLFGSGIPMAEKSFLGFPAFRLDHFQNHFLLGFYKKYLRTLDIRREYHLGRFTDEKRHHPPGHPEYLARISLLIRDYSYKLNSAARLHRQFFGNDPSRHIVFSDNLSFFTYLLIRQCSEETDALSLAFIPHSMARRETLWSRLFDINLPYMFLCDSSSSQASSDLEDCQLKLSYNPVFVYYSYSHCKRGILKFNPCLPDDVFLFLQLIDCSSSFYISRKPGSEPLYNLEDITRLPEGVRILQGDLHSYDLSSAYVLAIGHWGQIHSIKLSEGHTVIYFGEDVAQVPFRSIPVRAFSNADGVIISIDRPSYSLGRLSAWLILPPCSA